MPLRPDLGRWRRIRFFPKAAAISSRHRVYTVSIMERTVATCSLRLAAALGDVKERGDGPRG
jgi:hypothetical protein